MGSDTVEHAPKLPKWAIPLLSGGLAGTVAKSAIAPLERVKILFQIRSIHYPFNGVFPTLHSIYINEGIAGLWKGNNATVLRIFPYAAIQFYSYEKFKQLLHVNTKESGVKSTLLNLGAGSMAGATSVMFTYPLDLVRVRLAVSVKQKIYNGVFDCIAGIVRKEGFLALFRGMSPTLMGIVPYAGTNFAAFEALKRFSSEILGNDIEHVSIPTKLMCGGLAGAFGQTVSYPLDVVRRQMQTAGYAEGHNSFHKSTLSALQTIVAKDGIKGLFRGLSINYLRVGPQVALSFTTYETVKKYLEQL